MRTVRRTLAALVPPLALVGAGVLVMAPTHAGAGSPRPTPGYWLAGADGGVFSFGAPFYGSGASPPGACGFSAQPPSTANAAFGCDGIGVDPGRQRLLARQRLSARLGVRPGCPHDPKGLHQSERSGGEVGRDRLDGHREWILPGQLQRSRLGVRRCRAPRRSRRPDPRRARGGNCCHPGREGLLAGGVGRWGLRLRRCCLPRVDGWHGPRRAGGGHGRHPGREGLLAGGVGRRGLRLRRCCLPRVDGWHGPRCAGGGDRRYARRAGLLVGRVGRRSVLVRTVRHSKDPWVGSP